LAILHKQTINFTTKLMGSKTSVRYWHVIVLSHWPHVAEQVQQHVAEHVFECERIQTQIAELVAQLLSESFHTSHMCGNKSACSGDLWRMELTCARKCVSTCCSTCV